MYIYTIFFWDSNSFTMTCLLTIRPREVLRSFVDSWVWRVGRPKNTAVFKDNIPIAEAVTWYK